VALRGAEELSVVRGPVVPVTPQFLSLSLRNSEYYPRGVVQKKQIPSRRGKLDLFPASIRPTRGPPGPLARDPSIRTLNPRVQTLDIELWTPDPRS